MDPNTLILISSLAGMIGALAWAIVPKMYRRYREDREFSRIYQAFTLRLESGETVTEEDWAAFRAQLQQYLS
jgi:hypothetical protein